MKKMGMAQPLISLVPPMQRVPHPSRTLRRVGIGNACIRKLRDIFVLAVSYPPLQNAQGRGTLVSGGANERVQNIPPERLRNCTARKEAQEMFVDGLRIPERLVKLIDRGLWPRTEAEARRQHLRSLVPEERIHLFAPEEDKIYLMKPPFFTVTKLRSGGEEQFWATYGAPEGISSDLSVVIGAFEIGSDSPILLDYKEDRSNPTVIRLQWRKALGLPNAWVRCANNFDDFADMLGLE